MPTSKKKATAKKSSAKKAAAKSAKVTLQMALDPAKIAAIQRCLAKGTLKVTVSRVDLTRGRIRDPWLYD